MASTDQNKALRIALIVVGLTFVFGLYPLTVLWPDGFMWEPRQQEYEHMILITFAILGIFLLRAARQPSENRSLIAFAGWSSLAHGLLMMVQALRDPTEHANLFGDVPALVIVGIVLLALNRPARSAA
jgi:hypothetical protein